jgi:predicted enzyme related to lactoylglutathione lyase
MAVKNNIVGWFEVPVINMERAIMFYETIFGFKLLRNQMGPLDMAWFPYTESVAGAAGSLVLNKEFYKPSADGTLIYFSSQNGDLNDELSRVEKAGGKVIQEKTLITDDVGYMAVFLDTEGNRVALHSRK